MIMKLLIMRHAESLSKAAAKTRYDADRPLSTIGREQARQVGGMLTSIHASPTPIICSPFVRTQETAKLINQQLESPVPILPLTILAPGSSTDEILRASINYANPTQKWVLAVLHEPDVSLILGTWLYPDKKYPFEIYEGDLFAVNVKIGHGKSQGQLMFYYSPSQLNQA